jgi:hypothetical protein
MTERIKLERKPGWGYLDPNYDMHIYIDYLSLSVSLLNTKILRI